MTKTALLLSIFLSLTLCANAYSEDWQSSLDDAQAALRNGNLNEAEEGFLKTQKLIEAAKGSDKNDLKKMGLGLVDCLVGISKVKDKQGEFAQSDAVYEMGLETLKKFCEGGWKSHDYADYLPDIAELYDRHGKSEQTDLVWKRIIEIRTTVSPKDNGKIIAAYEGYSKYLRAHGKPEEANQWEYKANQLNP
ncbi:MAG: hypothetical protein K2X27_01545 [Candidatus Obscuribacterales bacterium]|nr:hypothetical protein [Candidatus Obscuribacterales bacterium]